MPAVDDSSEDPDPGSAQRHGNKETKPRMRLAVRGVPKGALRTHSAEQAPLWGSLVTCVVYCSMG